MTISCPKLSHQPRNGKPLSCPPYKCLINLTANYQHTFCAVGSDLHSNIGPELRGLRNDESATRLRQQVEKG